MKINGDDTYIPYLNDQLGHFARASKLIVFSGIGINAIVVIVEQGCLIAKGLMRQFRTALPVSTYWLTVRETNIATYFQLGNQSQET